MNKFTEEQIIKAAKHCSADSFGSCIGCPFDFNDRDCAKCIIDFAKYIVDTPKEKEEPMSSTDDINPKDNSIIDILYNTVKKIELCSADSWSRGYCKGVRETVDKLQNNKN